MNQQEQNKRAHQNSGRKPTPKWLKKLGRNLSQGGIAATIGAWIAVHFLNLVYWTNRFTVDPPDALDKVTPEQPVILAIWHGQHILLPALRINLPASVMISKSLDGEITARVAAAFGSKPIRASGGRENTNVLEKGGLRGFLDMLSALERGENVVQTADIPKGTPRRVGVGIIRLAAKSGCPIVPLAVASSRRHTFSKSWDKAALSLPFGRSSICMGELIYVSDTKNVGEGNLERARLQLENELNRITSKAYNMTGVPENENDG